MSPNYTNVSWASSFILFYFILYFLFLLPCVYCNMAALENVWLNVHDVEYVVKRN